MFYRCPLVIYSAQKNTLKSTKRGAGFKAQPGSCFSAPPAARADTGEHFTAEQPNPLLLASSGARPISPVESDTGHHKRLMLFGPGVQALLPELHSLCSTFGENGAWSSML